MKIIFNLLLTTSISYAAYLLIPHLHSLFGSSLLISSDTTVYWEWFDWLTVRDWIPRILTGLTLGILITLLIRGDGAHLWPLLSGMALMIASYTTSATPGINDQPLAQLLFQSAWPVMYPLGAFLGAVVVLSIRHMLSTRAAQRHNENKEY